MASTASSRFSGWFTNQKSPGARPSRTQQRDTQEGPEALPSPDPQMHTWAPRPRRRKEPPPSSPTAPCTANPALLTALPAVCVGKGSWSQTHKWTDERSVSGGGGTHDAYARVVGGGRHAAGGVVEGHGEEGVSQKGSSGRIQ